MEDKIQAIGGLLEQSGGEIDWNTVLSVFTYPERQNVHQVLRAMERAEQAHRYVVQNEDGTMSTVVRSGAKPDTTPPIVGGGA